MSIRYVYAPRFIGNAIAATDDAFSMTRLAAVVRKHYSVSATSDSLDLVQYNASSFDDAGDLYENVYSTYGTRVVDSATASDVAGGTTRTVTVNGVSGSYQCYKTVQYACTDYLTAGGRRVIVKAGTYTLGADLTFPSATGVSSTARRVLMGDPAELTLPVLTFSDGERQLFLNKNNSAEESVLRKLEISDVAGDVAGIVHFGSGFSFRNCIVEFCDIHDLLRPDTNNGVGIALYSESPDTGNSNIGVVIRYNHIHNIRGSGTTQNAAGIQSFHVALAEVYNNEIYDVPVAIYLKGQPSTINPGGWLIHSNKFYNIDLNAILFSIQGAGQPGRFSGDRVYNNLFYDCFGIYAQVYETGSQNTDIQVYQNTFAEDCGGAFAYNAVTNVQFHSNACACTTERVALEGPSGGYSNSLLLCDYNAHYTAQGNVWVTDRYASAQTYSSLAAWRAAYPTNTDLLADADENSITFSSLASVFSNTATRDYTAIGALVGAGKDGVNIGCDFATVGPGWTTT
jgi:hypothetical protein